MAWQWLGMHRSGLEMAGNGLEWLGMARNGSEWLGMAWNGSEWFGMPWNGLEWLGMAWNGTPEAHWGAREAGSGPVPGKAS